jgi:hypothetical protein
MGRRNGTSASKEVVVKVFVRFHELHFGPGIIAACTGYSPQYVRKMLDEEGHRERWHDSGDVLRCIDPDLASLAIRMRDKTIVN